MVSSLSVGYKNFFLLGFDKYVLYKLPGADATLAAMSPIVLKWSFIEFAICWLSGTVLLLIINYLIVESLL